MSRWGSVDAQGFGISLSALVRSARAKLTARGRDLIAKSPDTAPS
tara:strand:+ start:101 stop:235 length:135 start_codon:yes stop_codon:yes gene_type:complete